MRETAALVALGTIAVTGQLARWLPGGPRSAAGSAAIGGYAAAAADAAIFILLIHQFVTAPATLAPLPVAAAASASLARLVFARRAAQRCRTAWAALTEPWQGLAARVLHRSTGTEATRTRCPPSPAQHAINPITRRSGAGQVKLTGRG